MEQPPVTMNRIPILDLGPEMKQLKPQLMRAVEDVLDKGTFIMGEQVKQFEREAAEYLGVEHAVALNSGTDALVLALLSSGIGPGDEVITTPFTFFATAEAISQVGAVPVFADVEATTFNLDLDQAAELVTAKTKAIIPVHLFGHPVDMDGVLELADRHGLYVAEDTAQAFGAEYKGRRAGTIGDFGCFSFFPSKNLGAFGDGGMITTNNAVFAERAAMLRTHGSKKKYMNELVGFNSRLDELQAAMLRVKLPYIDQWNEGRRVAADRYRALLDGAQGIVLPAEADYAGHVYHQFTIRVLDGRRDELKAKLEEKGISSMVYYPVPVHRLPVYRYLGLSLPVSERLASEVLSIPIGPMIDPAVQKLVADSIIEALR
ncbi:DegT/DnrJ/EryC1/StrS aminotransferase family protein [Paenibacillus sp. J22TS3]|uniref:DegT/DnrJ/EryC1/StrS family aminotransferase n=1 Tax=Paenibacillus sp. J22TS3 TaxID=2807192 RepID=UPI001B1493F1|nr:DegT/DnrJ/EryC1/StrS family aminotransferase [Paenibacillus sp. J22TS3]GIP22014.1 aminotransferase [Paenibacillus sp. J22TS3]